MIYRIMTLTMVMTLALSCSLFAQGITGQPATTGQVQSQETPFLQAQPLMPTAIVGGSTTDYTLGKDDIVQIIVRNQPEFSGQYVIGPDGKIQYLFVGDITAEDLTKEELQEVITEKLKKYVKLPEVSVIIAGYRSKFLYILGAVGRPGKYPMAGNEVTLRDAIFAAGVPPYHAALRRTYVINPDNKKPSYRKVDLYRLLYKGILKDNLTLKPGDLVVVPTTVPSEINKALRTLLAPFSATASTMNTIDSFSD